jgi:hypothetical protein
MSIVIDIAAQFTGKKAFTQAENAADKLGRTVKHALIGVGVTAFAKSAISAFAAQEKQLTLFKNSLRTIGFEFATNDSLAFLNSLKLQYGVTDTELIPAYEQLLTTTRSLAASQNLTNVAMDIAARQGISVTQAADALSKAYLGNTKSVGALGLGISKATLASGDFASILKEITNVTKGSAAAAADTFSGKLARIKVAADTAKESIGAGLVEALMQISKSTDIDQLQGKIINFGNSAAETLGNIGRIISENIVLIKAFGALMIAAFAVNKIAAFIIALEKIVKTIKMLRNAALAAAAAEMFMLNPLAGAAMTAGMFAAIGLLIKGVDALSESTTRATENLANLFGASKALGVGGDQGGAAKYAEGAAARAAADAKAAAAAQLKATKAQTKALQDQAKLNKAKTLFDIDQIQILAALQGKVTDEEKLRLSLQMALLQGNAAEAERLSKELAASQLLTTNLAYAIANLPAALNPFADWGSEIDDLLAQLMAMYDLINKLSKPIIPPIIAPSNVLSAGQQIPFQFGLDPSQIGAGGSIIGSAATFNPLPISAGISQNTQDYSQLSRDVASMFTGFGQTSTNVNYVYNINGATTGLLNELRNGLIDSSASGSFATINSPAG